MVSSFLGFGVLLLLIEPGCGEEGAAVGEPESVSLGDWDRQELEQYGPPSVLLLTVDTLRPDYLGMYGYDLPSSPYLDRLLADAFHFESAVTPVPRTTPALASLLTGAYPHGTGVRRLGDRLDEDFSTLAEVFLDEGYQTLAVVTNQVLSPARNLNQGFETYDFAGDTRSAQQTTGRALQKLKELDPQRPVFAWIHYIDPHMPYLTDPERARSFDPEYEGRYREAFGNHRKRDRNNRWIPRSGPFPADLPKKEAMLRNPLPAEVNEHINRLYAADIRETDDHLEPLLRQMSELSGGNLIVVFTSDHGESLGEHDYYFHHGDYVFNAASRVPLAFLLPKHHPLHGPGRAKTWVSLVDVAPTLLDLIGMQPGSTMASRMEGRSLVPALAGAGLADEPVFVESGHAQFFESVRRRVSNDIEGRFRAVFFEDWKLIWTPGLKEPGFPFELYRLDVDPEETEDLARPGHPRLEELERMLRGWLERGEGQVYQEGVLSEEDREALEALGYTGSEDDLEGGN